MAPADRNRNVPKSSRSNQASYVTFINRTDFPVDIIWRDYGGGCIRYRSKLEPGCHHYQNTYVTHPWQAWNSNTLEKVNIGGNYVFQPRPWRGEMQRTVVYIDRPVTSLLKLCLQHVRGKVKRPDIDQLEIPRFLQEKLKKRRQKEVRDIQRNV